ncbi:FAD/NAD-P-binding domain-containing protein [Mycena metata]|uniref:FAD/NAD-P-binding domain-containing protein n=1 Tax=Mycena metata TaxID=1033252 RepID=A0AAD7IAU9_9AGAR|nr:FAD/NAD-P-binding domain-containing protein [Mycena metata]
MAFPKSFLAFLAFGISVFAQNEFQTVLDTRPEHLGETFHHPIRRVAVVGAGPAGLQAAANLIEHNFAVRLFERAPHPGGNWLYSEETPIREPYPDMPVGQNPDLDIPYQLPIKRYYNDGDDDLTLNHRWTEHWRPRPVWYNLFTNSPKVSTELPDVTYHPGTPWVLSHQAIQRHVRSYASHHCINSNDYCPATPSAPRVASYSTRVEKVEKDAEVLTLRRLERLQYSNQILEEWWTETFDAVVLATGPYTSAHVPEIDGIVDWSKAKEGEHYSIYHSQSYRHPERYARKTVLIVGASVSASEIARDISPFVHRIIASVRPPTKPIGTRLRSLSRFPNTTELVPEIASFEPLKTHTDGIREGKIHLINGSTLQGIDEIILATGYQSTAFNRTLFFAYIFALKRINSPARPHANTSWMGHYIPDPTLAYSSSRAWTMGRYQYYGLAKLWEGTARLPPPEEIEEPDTRPEVWLGEGTPHWLHRETQLFRRYITWLNDASLEYGGRFVQPPPIEYV